MTATTEQAAGVAAYYDKAAGVIPSLTVLNYGFSSDPEDSRVPRDNPEFYCLRLYEHTVRDVKLDGAEVLEVSCGRGGGASYLTASYHPKRYVGVDLSEENLRMARQRDPAVEWVQGPADALAFPEASFDVVINIEASHLYDDRKAFFAEVYRVLRSGGSFCYTDGCWADDDCTNDLLNAGFELRERLEITHNVIRALELDNARREALFDTIADPALREEYKGWGGVIGYRAYQRFVEGQTRYFSHLLRRP